MFQDMHNLQQEVKAKQVRFQGQAAQQRMVKACVIAGQSRQIVGQPEKREPWLLTLGLRSVKQPK